MNTPEENLKTGNPELTDECTAYGLNRAAELMDRHALKGGTDLLAFKRRYPHPPLMLGEIQVAAIVAEAYRAGVEDGRASELREQEEAGNRLHAAVTGPWAQS